MLTDHELARRFAAHVAVMDADEAAWLEQPQRGTARRSPILRVVVNVE
jgi:hypothetical protein